MIIDPNNVPMERGTNYPDAFKAMVAGRIRQRLGNFAGLKNFGVNLVQLEPGSFSALRHWHSHQDEFIYILAGELTLITDAGEEILTPGMAAGFPAGEANGHHLVNRSAVVGVYLEVGDRTPNDQGFYPDVPDLMTPPSPDGKSRQFIHQDGTLYE
ncbi:Cupin region [Trichormus variabilis ATCC 29413]|uniref:Cupin region n=2 Tax=Anabaena variabilis TaxID=264691 RepID=Q3M360_TRIV2|nr:MULTISPECIES: cupin domain-containing protein [Nostocaceae]ABA24576.1 Cupin region [Trichormus variabilis ATCC 29413]MBC1215839.1 cupin domain-containing protein [Trichormus variabilis ARAD]MBC1256061.1 cupin domain-containing protein [Trichormus variabilis V5]MBC1269414.1 cupin domain-containing protein [Trichormus variabilis FSR]MBC1304468.1 cupin domain-containing protein [Trichormus variabilis N2B]